MTSAWRTSLWPIVVVAVNLLADAAQACPSCVDPRDSTRSAMIAGTIALSLLPLGFIGGVAAWLWRAHKHSGDDDVDSRS
jgi:hypothetical protein